MQKRDDKLKQNPSLKPFFELSEVEKAYDYEMAFATLSTLIALGYQISTTDHTAGELPYLELSPDQYLMPNDYLPRPLNLQSVVISKCLHGLVEKLAENGHMVWAASRVAEGWTFGAATVSWTHPYQ